jgi:hypothetical protein
MLNNNTAEATVARVYLISNFGDTISYDPELKKELSRSNFIRQHFRLKLKSTYMMDSQRPVSVRNLFSICAL